MRSPLAGRPATAARVPVAALAARLAALRALAPLALLLLAACMRPLTPMARPVPAAPPSVVTTPAAPSAEAEYLLGRQLMVPVAGVEPSRLQDTFAAARDGGARRHNALDIMAPRGTPVLAADDGRVMRVSTNGLGGLTVYLLDPAERYVYYYAHLDAWRDGLRSGMTVARGEVLGYVGSTGNASASAPHLHFQAMRYRRDRYWDGEPVNPLPYLVTPGQPLTAITANGQR